MYILCFYFAENFHVYALSAAFRDGKTSAEIRWQESDNLDKSTRGIGVAIINPLTDGYQYQKFDTVYPSQVNVVCFEKKLRKHEANFFY